MATPANPQDNLVILPSTPAELAGEVRAFTDLRAVAEYESALTQHYMPDIYREHLPSAIEVWIGRKSLVEALRPAKFYGNISNIVVSHFEEPFDELTTRVPMYATSLSKYEDWYREHIVGMAVQGELRSTGRPGIITSLNTGLWLYPRHLAFNERGKIPSGIASSKGAYHRVVDRPRQVEESVEELVLRSSSIGLKILKQAMARPLTGGFETAKK